MAETIKSAGELVEYYWSKNIPTYLHSAPGLGKSSLARQLAKKHKVGFIDVRLGQKLPEDLSGIPTPDLENRLAVWLRAEFWPDVKRDGKEGIILFDELSDAPRSLQSCAYQIILDRQISSYKLPAGWYPMAAGNRREDRAAAQALSTALANRFAHIEIEADIDAFVEYANGPNVNIDPMLVGFLRYRPNLLHSMEGANLLTFPTPRAWEQVSKVMDAPTAALRMKLVRGLVGEGPAIELEQFLKVCDLPDLNDVVKDPKRCRIPKEPGARYAMASMLSRGATRQNLNAVTTYTRREEFGREFEIVMMLDACKRDASLTDTQAFVDWGLRNKDITL